MSRTKDAKYVKQNYRKVKGKTQKEKQHKGKVKSRKAQSKAASSFAEKREIRKMHVEKGSDPSQNWSQATIPGGPTQFEFRAFQISPQLNNPPGHLP